MNTEKSIHHRLQRQIARRPDIRLFRNNVGEGWCGRITRRIIEELNLRRVKFGLHVGSGDLIGWKSITITPADVGRRVAVFLSIETKKPKGGRASDEQRNWQEQVRLSGGIAEIISDPEQMDQV